MERMTDQEKAEQTIQGLMELYNLTREEATRAMNSALKEIDYLLKH